MPRHSRGSCRILLTALAAAALFTAGCASVPPAAVDVTPTGVKSTVGIKTNRAPQALE
jgi:PBP1b-binding outer membrane lipoprotein LpoB